jgi:hypothetical protein
MHVRKDGYIGITINGKPFLEHRIVWEKAKGTIPRGFHVHHVNGCRSDNSIENLELVEAREHNRFHSLARGHKPCMVVGCGNLAVAKRLCPKHYARKKKFGNVNFVTQSQWWPRKNGRYNRSGFRGVKEDCGKFQAKIAVNGMQIYLGRYSTAQDAAKAYDDAARKYHGAIAVTNEKLGLLAA